MSRPVDHRSPQRQGRQFTGPFADPHRQGGSETQTDDTDPAMTCPEVIDGGKDVLGPAIDVAILVIPDGLAGSEVIEPENREPGEGELSRQLPATSVTSDVLVPDRVGDDDAVRPDVASGRGVVDSEQAFVRSEKERGHRRGSRGLGVLGLPCAQRNNPPLHTQRPGPPGVPIRPVMYDTRFSKTSLPTPVIFPRPSRPDRSRSDRGRHETGAEGRS